MVEESSIAESNYIFLAQTQNSKLEHLIAEAVAGHDLQLMTVDHFSELENQQQEGRVITFVIGSDVEDPIQSAQRFHAYQKKAKIVLLSKKEKNRQALQEAVKFSPFIGEEVYCLNQSEPAELKSELSKILEGSIQGEKYQSFIQETNAQIALHSASPAPSFNQHFINKLMDIAPIGIAIVGQNGNILGWNKEAAGIFNKNEAQVLGTPLSHYFGSWEKNALKRYLRESVHEGQQESDPLSIERTSVEDRRQFLFISAAAFTYSNGAHKALILAIKDVSEREKAKQQLQQVNNTLEDRVKKRTASLLSYQDQLRSLASKLSKAEEKERRRLATELHDNLGQMLAVCKMKMDLLTKDNLPEETASDLEEIKRGMEDALVYTRDLMSDLKPPPTLDKEDIRATIQWLANKMKKHGLEVTVKDDGEPKRATEEIQTTLLQSVRELLFNVIKHTEVSKALITMKRLDHRVQVVVKDQGQGSEKDLLNTVSTEKGGYGLFNIKERLDLLGGKMEADSAPDFGTRVTLTAPLKPTAGATDSDENEHGSGPFITEEAKDLIRVLLADDHRMVREGLKKIVDAEDDMTVVAEASNGEGAVELAKETAPDIVVMDVNMPKMNGIDATQEILSTLSDIRIVGLSLHDHQNVVEGMRNAGATAYLTKNEAFETLCATIRSEAKLSRK